MARVLSLVGESGPRPDPVPANDPLFAGLVLTEPVGVRGTALDAYAVVSDIARIGELSPECVSAEWAG